MTLTTERDNHQSTGRTRGPCGSKRRIGERKANEGRESRYWSLACKAITHKLLSVLVHARQ